MSKKLDADVLAMSYTERGQYIMRLRRLVKKALTSNNNHACWINIVQLLQELELVPGIITLDQETFLRNCNAYCQSISTSSLVKIQLKDKQTKKRRPK